VELIRAKKFGIGILVADMVQVMVDISVTVLGGSPVGVSTVEIGFGDSREVCSWLVGYPVGFHEVALALGLVLDGVINGTHLSRPPFLSKAS
jgi:hypothetical protein